MGHRILRHHKKPNILIRNADLRNRRREKVAAAAVELFLRDGFHNTGVRQIAHKAGVSPGAVLTYFRDKEEILFYIFETEQGKGEARLAELMQQIRLADPDEADPYEIIEQVVDTYVQAIEEVRRFTLLAYQETKSLRPDWRQQLFAREQRIQTLLVEAIEYGVQQGTFAPGNLNIKAHSITMLVHAWAIRRWALKEVSSPEAYAYTVKPLILGMLTFTDVERAKCCRKDLIAIQLRRTLELRRDKFLPWPPMSKWGGIPVLLREPQSQITVWGIYWASFMTRQRATHMTGMLRGFFWG